MRLNNIHGSAGVSDRQEVIEIVVHSVSPSSVEVAGDTKTTLQHGLFSSSNIVVSPFLFISVCFVLLVWWYGFSQICTMQRFHEPCLVSSVLLISMPSIFEFTSLSIWGPSSWLHASFEGYKAFQKTLQLTLDPGARRHVLF
jgi:hypothetical protein